VSMSLHRSPVPAPCPSGTTVSQGSRHGRSSANYCIRGARQRSSDRDLANTEGLHGIWLLAYPAECPPCSRTLDWQAASLTQGMMMLDRSLCCEYGSAKAVSRWKESKKRLAKLGWVSEFFNRTIGMFYVDLLKAALNHILYHDCRLNDAFLLNRMIPMNIRWDIITKHLYCQSCYCCHIVSWII